MKTFLALLFLIPNFSISHEGKLNRYGCHNKLTAIEEPNTSYHCHSEPMEKEQQIVKFPSNYKKDSSNFLTLLKNIFKYVMPPLMIIGGTLGIIELSKSKEKGLFLWVFVIMIFVVGIISTLELLGLNLFS